MLFHWNGTFREGKKKEKLSSSRGFIFKSPIFPCFFIEFDWKVAKHRRSVTPSCAEVSQLFYSLLCVPLLVCLQRKESLFLLCFAEKSVRSVDLIQQASEPGNWTIEDTGNTKIWERFEWFRLRVTQLWKRWKKRLSIFSHFNLREFGLSARLNQSSSSPFSSSGWQLFHLVFPILRHQHRLWHRLKLQLRHLL